VEFHNLSWSPSRMWAAWWWPPWLSPPSSSFVTTVRCFFNFKDDAIMKTVWNFQPAMAMFQNVIAFIKGVNWSCAPCVFSLSKQRLLLLKETYSPDQCKNYIMAWQGCMFTRPRKRLKMAWEGCIFTRQRQGLLWRGRNVRAYILYITLYQGEVVPTVI
jgi:hypothetical protein